MRRKEYGKKIQPRDASRIRVGIVVSRFNADITRSLLDGALDALLKWNVRKSKITVAHVAGSFEIPYGCLSLIKKMKPDCIIALGCIIKGETKHDEYLASAVSHGLMSLSLDFRTPISFGVITVDNLKQARARSSGRTNKGREAAIAAMESALF